MAKQERYVVSYAKGEFHIVYWGREYSNWRFPTTQLERALIADKLRRKYE